MKLVLLALRAMATTNPEDKMAAAAMRSGSAAANLPAAAANLPACMIEDGIQKYVLIRVGDRHLVRGMTSAAYHRDAAKPTVDKLRELGASYEVLGGGRIAVNTPEKTISIYGFSYGFPWPDGVTKHDVAAAIVQADYPSWTVSTSDEGY